MKNIIFYIIVLSTLFSCKKASERNCIKSSGENTVVVMEDMHLKNISVFDNISLTLVHDSLNKLEVKGGENLIPFVELLTDHKTITISNENKCNFLRKEDEIEVIYHFTDLDSIFLYGFGNLISRDTLRNDLYIYTEGSFSSIDLTLANQNTTLIGQVGGIEADFSGFTNSLYMYSSGAGKYDASRLTTALAHGHSTGLGDIHLKATELLIVELRSKGNFYLYEIPDTEVIITKTGSGEIFYE